MLSKETAIRRFKRYHRRSRNSGRQRMNWTGKFSARKEANGYHVKFVRTNGQTMEMFIGESRKHDCYYI